MRTSTLSALSTVLAGLLWTIPPSPLQAQEAYNAARDDMVDRQIIDRGIDQPKLLDAMKSVPRQDFVPEPLREEAYSDRSLPIGWGQFISQPYLSARMIELLELDGSERVLEIGTGSGYDAAVLSRVAKEVYTIEIIDTLGERAKKNLEKLGYDNVFVRIGDGYQGWPEKAPFDAIILTAAPPDIPEPLFQQLKVSGRMVVPVGEFFQDLLLITKTADGREKRTIMPIRLGKMSGEVRTEQ